MRQGACEGASEEDVCKLWWGCPDPGIWTGEGASGCRTGPGHLVVVVVGGLDTPEALNLPQPEGWAHEGWEHLKPCVHWPGQGQCRLSTSCRAVLPRGRPLPDGLGAPGLCSSRPSGKLGPMEVVESVEPRCPLGPERSCAQAGSGKPQGAASVEQSCV